LSSERGPAGEGYSSCQAGFRSNGDGLAELKTQFAEYQRSIGDANLARRTHTGAQAALRVLAREIMTMVQQLDGIVGYQFQGKPEVLGAWESARNVAWPTATVKLEIGIKLEKPAA
jgi:hypothetical protein